jgi:hypothetical protein
MKKYKKLIQNLPFEDQAFKPNKKVWTDLLDYNKCLEHEFDWVHGYSRADLFGMPLDCNKLISILMWGYTTGGRGNHIRELIGRLPKVKEIIEIYEGRDIDSRALTELIVKLEAIEHLGRSTWTKFLYFSDITYHSNRLLILDERIGNALGGKTYEGIKFCNLDNSQTTKAIKRAEIYLEYLENMLKLSRKIDVKTDQLELFFFMFSDILRL